MLFRTILVDSIFLLFIIISGCVNCNNKTYNERPLDYKENYFDDYIRFQSDENYIIVQKAFPTTITDEEPIIIVPNCRKGDYDVIEKFASIHFVNNNCYKKLSNYIINNGHNETVSTDDPSQYVIRGDRVIIEDTLSKTSKLIYYNGEANISTILYNENVKDLNKYLNKKCQNKLFEIFRKL